MLESNSPASSFTVPVMVFCCPKEINGSSINNKRRDGRWDFIPVLRLDKMDISIGLFNL
jgi:hypothetical protein